jgi:aerobic-type carbon monoxide dehydrogenase small subunit (CoxS/CutS family)
VTAMSGNVCRCGAYPNIVRSVQAAADAIERAGQGGE